MKVTKQVDADAAAFRALGHPIRLGIVTRLARDGEICACDFTDVFGVSQPTISGHLRTLREAGLVQTRRQGTQVCYSLHPRAINQAEATLAQLGMPRTATGRNHPPAMPRAAVPDNATRMPAQGAASGAARRAISGLDAAELRRSDA